MRFAWFFFLCSWWAASAYSAQTFAERSYYASQTLRRQFYGADVTIHRILGDVAAVESPKFPQSRPVVQITPGLYGTGKTATILATIRALGIPDHLIHYHQIKVGDVVLPVQGIYQVVKDSNWRLGGLFVFDEFLNLKPWGELQGLKPPPPPIKKTKKKPKQKNRRTYDEEPRRQEEDHGGDDLDDLDDEEEEVVVPPEVNPELFWETEKGQRIRMWLDLQEVFGSGHLIIDTKQLSKLYAAFLTQRKLNLQSYNAHDPYADFQRIISLLARLHTENSAAQKAQADAEEELGIRQQRLESIRVKIETIQQQRSKLKNAKRLTALNTQEAKLNQDKLALSNEMSPLQSKASMNRQTIADRTPQFVESMNQLLQIVDFFLAFTPHYLKMVGYPDSQVDYIQWFRDPHNLEAIALKLRDPSLRIADQIVIERGNLIFYFLGNPKRIIESLEADFKKLRIKDPDSLRHLITSDPTFSKRLKAEITQQLGLDWETIENDPEVPDSIKTLIKTPMGAVVSRLNISGLQFQLPFPNEKYMGMLEHWLSQIEEAVEHSVQNKINLKMAIPEASMQELFNAAVDAWAVIRGTESNFKDISRPIYSQLASDTVEILIDHGIAVFSPDKPADGVDSTKTSTLTATLQFQSYDRDGGRIMQYTINYNLDGEDLTRVSKGAIPVPSKSWEQGADEGQAVTHISDLRAAHQAGHLILGMDYFGSFIEMNAVDFESDILIGSSLWRTLSPLDARHLFDAAAVLLAGPIMEEILKSRHRFERFSEEGIKDTQAVRRIIGRLLDNYRQRTRDTTQFLNTGGSGDLGKYLFERFQLDLSAGHTERDEVVNLIFNAIHKEATEKIKSHFGMIRDVTRYLDQNSTISSQVLFDLLQNHTDWSEPYPYHSFSQAQIEQIQHAPAGSVQPHLYQGLDYAHCVDIFAGRGGSQALAFTTATPEVLPPPPVAPEPPPPPSTDATPRTIGGRVTVQDVIDELQGFIRDLSAHF